MIDSTKIANSKLITDFYGKWPSFHDCEVISIRLDRRGPTLRASIYTFQMTPQTDDRGYIALDKKAVVTLVFHEVRELSITDFNHQNSLQGLAIRDISSRQMEGIHFEVDGIFGVSASFNCSSIEVVSIEERAPEEVSGTSVQGPPKRGADSR